MKLAIDVGYHDNGATAAGVLFENWNDASPCQEVCAKIAEVAAYESGQFYKRELPCITELLQSIESDFDTILIDGFVWLSDDQPTPAKGLGAYLFDLLDQKIPVIGVAKTEFVGSGAAQVLRGTSQRPLYVTAAGIQQGDAVKFVQSMQGENRIPTLLKRVDQLSRIV